jgi:hypothetical protein
MRRSFTKLAALAAMIAAAGSPAAGIGHAAKYEAVRTKDVLSLTKAERRLLSSGSGYGRPKTDFSGNQRQYRKKMRQNPCRFNSKKHRGNN